MAARTSPEQNPKSLCLRFLPWEDSVEGIEDGLQSCLGYLQRHWRCLRRPMGKRSRKKKVAGSGVIKNVTTTSVRVQGPPSRFRGDWLWGLILILSVLLAYTPVWQTGFIWDDDVHLTANPCIV